MPTYMRMHTSLFQALWTNKEKLLNMKMRSFHREMEVILGISVAITTVDVTAF